MGFQIGEVARGDVEAAAKNLLPPSRPHTDVGQLLRGGGVVVVVGGKPGNFSHAQLQNPRIVFWHGTDPKTSMAGRTFPSNARAVLFSGVISHDREHTLRRQAKERGIFAAPGLLTTGDIREMLDALTAIPKPIVKDPDPLPLQRPPEVQTPPSTVVWQPATQLKETRSVKTLRPLHRGELKAFVLKHATARESATAQAPRLLKQLADEGIDSTLASVAQAVRVNTKAPRQRMTALNADNMGADFVSMLKDSRFSSSAPATPAAAAEPASATPRRESLLSTAPDVDVLNQIESALHTAEDLKASAELLADALTKIQADVRRMQQVKAALREYLT